MENRRQYPRFTVENLHGRMVSASHVEVVNMSISGVALRVDRRLTVGGQYTLKLELEDRVVSVEGEVVWSVLTEIRKDAGGDDRAVYSAGMKFVNVLTPRIRELMSFIDDNKILKEQRLTGLRLHIDAPGKAVLDYPEGYRVRVLSLSGMSIETEHPLKTDEVCPLEIDLPVGRPVGCAGRVVSCTEGVVGERRFYQVGVEFQDLPAADRMRLARYLDSL